MAVVVTNILIGIAIVAIVVLGIRLTSLASKKHIRETRDGHDANRTGNE